MKLEQKKTPMERYWERKRYAIEYLGGKCVRCGSTKNLHLDHKDKFLKSFNIGEKWSISLEKYTEELKKCQLLCKTCHKLKSDEDQDWGVLGYGPTHHGTASMYKKGCRCEPCKKDYNREAREYRQLQRLERILNE